MITGKLLTKTVRFISVSKFEKQLDYAEETQINTLQRIINMNKNTVFGRAHNFQKISDIESYQRFVPIFNYSKLKPYVNMILQGHSNVLFSSKHIWWVKSSGTTGKPKLYPISEQRLIDDRKITARELFCYLLWDKENFKVMKGKMLSFVAAAVMEHINDIPVGYISGVIAFTQGKIIQRLMAIPKYVVNIKDPLEKYYETLLHALNNNITLISGTSSFVVRALKYLYEPILDDILMDSRIKPNVRKKIEHLRSLGQYKIKQIWNNLRMMAWSGVNIKPYLSWIYQYIGSIDLLEMYIGSEGMYAFQMYPEEGLVLNIDKYFFEFVPEEEWNTKRNPTRLTISEIKRGHRYVLLVTGNSGLYSYSLDDVIEVVKTDPVMIRVIGKVGKVLNIATEKLTEQEVGQALMRTAEKCDAVIGEYIVIPKVKNGQGMYQFYIHFNREPSDFRTFESTLDETLKDANYVYKLVRDEEIIVHPRVQPVSKAFFDYIETKLLEEGKPLGQFKPLHIEPVEPFEWFLKEVGM